jgi:RNA polymerase sigma-54 factor
VAPETAEGPEPVATAPDAPPPTPVEPAPVEPLPTSERQTDDLPFDLTAVMFDDNNEERSLVAQEEREELPFENIARTTSSLADHLDEQLRFATEDPTARRIGDEIIGNLDADGYLRAEVAEIAGRCGVAAEEVEKILALVQGFDPPGVAARSVSECLLLQLRADPAPDPLAI